MKTWIIFIGLAISLTILTGFTLDNAIVPKEDILSGGPPKDGIPALLKPKFVQPDEAKFLKPSDQVLGVRLEGQAKAYPINILNWHEAVNDTLGKTPLVATF